MKRKEQPCVPAISVEVMERMAQALKVLAHPCRLRIIEILEAAEAVPVHVIVGKLGLPQSATSQHLNHMRRAGLLTSERRGKEVWYRIGDKRSLTILNCIRTKGVGQ